jgi:hypothetical protein
MSVLETCTPRDKLPCPCISVTSPDPPLERKQFLFGLRTKLLIRFSYKKHCTVLVHYISQSRLPLREARWFNDEVIFGLARVLMLA